MKKVAASIDRDDYDPAFDGIRELRPQGQRSSWRNGKPPVRIPFVGCDDHQQPLRDCIMAAAEASNLPPTQVALIVSRFLSAVGEQVLFNRIVRFPGFGAFGPMTRFGRKRNSAGGLQSTVFVAFVACRALKAEVRLRVFPADSKETDPMRRIAANNSQRTSRQDRRFTDVGVAVRRVFAGLHHPQWRPVQFAD